jgi:hypothetical protein
VSDHVASSSEKRLVSAMQGSEHRKEEGQLGRPSPDPRSASQQLSDTVPDSPFGSVADAHMNSVVPP